MGENEVEIIQIELKGERSDYFLNKKRLPIEVGDYVVVQVERGRDCLLYTSPSPRD